MRGVVGKEGGKNIFYFSISDFYLSMETKMTTLMLDRNPTDGIIEFMGGYAQLCAERKRRDVVMTFVMEWHYLDSTGCVTWTWPRQKNLRLDILEGLNNIEPALSREEFRKIPPEVIEKLRAWVQCQLQAAQENCDDNK